MSTHPLELPFKLSTQIQASHAAPHVLLILLNRPEAMNAMSREMEANLTSLLNWFQENDDYWVAVISGNGKIFCAGADLVDWLKRDYTGFGLQVTNDQEKLATMSHGFGSVSRRYHLNKPIIAAVNGGAFGGGTEMILNCDIVIAEEDAKFAFSEVKHGVIAAAGGIPKLLRTSGHQLAAEMLLLGRNVTAVEARDRFRFVNEVVPHGKSVETAIAWAMKICENSPDAVQATKHGLMLALLRGGVEEAFTSHTWSEASKKVWVGENMKEGLRAFFEKRKPAWGNPSTKL
ncbi:ClpP/crotonase-like domain-containing protein [Thelephora terrestris]|uniref:ClpP/crotonase-like domain-containing protein n=1 Tax=Thelephora terrestris TaxID=56493 RepID=A0A9P6L827_9AGAM|nr:ClpP/crotonase-like domain-containing protein [Thelephora terrestris]